MHELERPFGRAAKSSHVEAILQQALTSQDLEGLEAISNDLHRGSTRLSTRTLLLA